jgi:hypothetical protein
MKRMLFSITIVALGLVALTAVANAQTALQIYPDQSVGVLSEDPTIGDRWSRSILPFGNYVGPVSGDVFCRTYLHFPLGGIPAGATVQSAAFHVYVDDFWPDDKGAPMSVYPVVVAWTEGGVDWNDSGAWPALGGASATTTVSASQGWYAWDVTSLVQGWVGGMDNSGLAVAAADLGSTTSNWAAARRLGASDASTRPYLEVVFSAPQPPPQPTSAPEPLPPSGEPSPSASTPEVVLLPVSGEGGAVSAVRWWGLAGVGVATAGLALRVAPSAVRFVGRRRR